MFKFADHTSQRLFSEHGAMMCNARFSRMVPFKTQLLYNFQKMEGGVFNHFQSHTEPCTGRFTKTSQGTMSGHLARGGTAPSPHRKARQSSAGLTRKSTAELRRSLGACICAGSNLLPATFPVADAIDLPTGSGRNTERIPKLGLQAAVDAQCPGVSNV